MDIEKMESIYGKGYEKDYEGYPVYQYYNGKEYLNIFHHYGHIECWDIRTFSHINND